MTLQQQFFLLFAITFSLLAGCEKHEETTISGSQKLPAATVSVARVEKQVADNQIQVVGTVQAVQQARISAKVSGNITAISVDLGSRVTEGQMLIQLSAEEISAQLQQAKAQLEQARRNLAREESLLKKKAATPESVKSLRDTVRIAEAAHREAKTMLGYTKITAPFSGIVTRKIANVGDLATPTKPLLHIENESRLQVLTDIPEAMILNLKEDDRLGVSIPSADLLVDGIVAEISPTIDPSSRSASIKLHIASHPKLRSGQFARVTLTMDRKETLVVPSPAVIPYGQIERVFVEHKGHARLRLVRTGSSNEIDTEILSGLNENETVITSGNENLVDGQSIVVK
ncbi:MAG: efflux RND transporter periplasmic adaptor subunit [Desulforhopalus sp.]